MIRLEAGVEKERIAFNEFVANKGEFWHVLGQNGAGKTSLLLVLAGLLGEHKLHYYGEAIASIPLQSQAKTRCFLHQQQHAEFDIPLHQLLRFYTHYEALPESIERYLNLNGLLNKTLSTLSGGQQQRFHIARNLLQVWEASALGKAIIILDEPIAQLDIKYQASVLMLLQQLCQQGNIVLMSCHDINHSVDYSTHVALIERHRLRICGKTSDCLTMSNLQQIFEHKFKELAVPDSSKSFVVSASI